MVDALALFREKHMHLAARVDGRPGDAGLELAPWAGRTRSKSRLLERWLDGLRVANGCALAVSGVGDGSHLVALLARLPDTCLIFCAEPSVERFNAFLGTSDAATILADSRVLMGVGELDDAFFRSLASFRVMDFTSAEPVIFAPLFCEAEGYYESFFLQFARQFDMWRKMYGTNLTKSGLWQRNTFRNLRSLIASPDPIAFQGIFRGAPLIMAGAGPSLDESLEFIRWAQDKAVIVAGNSSIRALRRAGVDPHFVLAADPNETTDLGFEGVDLGRTHLICPFMVYPKVVDRFEGRVSAWSFGNEAATLFRTAQGQTRSAFVTEQGTVSACAFDLAVILGCPTIFFAGQDLAAAEDGRMHASDSFYSDTGPDKVDLKSCRWFPGNTLEKVAVEGKLFVYLKTFEELAHAYGTELKLDNGKGLTLYNISRLGARIEGMPYLDLAEARETLESMERSDVEKGWKEALGISARHSSGWGRVGKVLAELRDYVEAVCSSALKAAMAIELGKLELPAAKAARAELERLVVSRPEFQKVLEDGHMKFELHVHRRGDALKARSATGGAAELESLGSYFWAISEGSYQMLVSIDGSRRPKEANSVIDTPSRVAEKP